MNVIKLGRRLAVAREKLAEHNAWQRWLARKMLPCLQPLGFSVLGDHFYEPVPNLKQIQRHYQAGARQLPGFVPSARWMENAKKILLAYIGEYRNSQAFTEYGRKNWFYTGWDAAYYYCLIRSVRPRRITEVGRGVSTHIACLALKQNIAEGYPGELVSIDPYFRGNVTGPARIMRTGLQQISPNERTELTAADIFFIDSSHVVKWGSDVLELFEAWIPNVTVNARVHIHDIFTPYEYPREWFLQKKRFWNEQYIFEAFQAFNSNFRIECPIFYLAKSGDLARLAEQNHFPELYEASGSAMWLQKIQ